MSTAAKIRKTPRRQFVGFGILSAAFVALAALVPVNAMAGGVAPKKSTDIVTVEAMVGPSPSCPLFGTQFDRQINPDGSVTTFAIPAGEKFVITSFDWSGTGMNTSSTVVGSVVAQTGASFENLLTTSETTDSAGRGGASSALTTGVVVNSTPALCLAIDSGLVTLEGHVHGFLTNK